MSNSIKIESKDLDIKHNVSKLVRKINDTFHILEDVSHFDYGTCLNVKNDVSNHLVLTKPQMDIGSMDMTCYVERCLKISTIIFDSISVLNFGRMYLGFVHNCFKNEEGNVVFNKDGNVFSIDLITIISAVITIYPHPLTDSELVYKIAYLLNPKQ